MSGVLDRAHFRHMTGDDRALQLEIVELFRAQAANWGDGIASDAEWRAAAHKLKGSARGIGLATLALACEAVEGAPDAACAEALDHLRVELAEALAALEQFAAEA